MIEILYLTFNRKAYTAETLAALLANTNWREVSRVVVYDDCSSDGTRELLGDVAPGWPVPMEIVDGRFGSPVTVMNEYLQRPAGGDVFCKLDSDTMVPPGWLDECLAVMADPKLGILGIEACARPRTGSRGYEPTRVIGGIGLMRRDLFREELRPHHIYGGFGDWQLQHPEIIKGWISPALEVFLLDRLPMNPWREMSDEYIRRGWQRPWKNYTQADSHLWRWWQP